jgi:hypothetical protein
MRKFILALAISCLAVLAGQAQELQCEVVVNSDQVPLTDRRIFSDLRNAVANYLNSRRWTDQVYRPEERIECRLLINITEAPQVGHYSAFVQVVSSRPVYGTGYNTQILNFIDKSWSFEYTEAQPLQFSDNSFTSNLASLLSFYAYTIIGLDRDTFGKLGGSRYYDQAMQVVNNVTSQGQNNPGWKAFEDNRNRYWLLNNLQDPQLEGFRSALYLYYRQGMDIFIQQPDQARKNILEAIRSIRTVAQLKPGAAVLRSFFETKADEIVSVFKGAPPADKQAVYAVLSEIDPTNITKYQNILQK